MVRSLELVFFCTEGLAMSASGDLYIADGTNIRVVTAAGTIHTVLGGHEHR